MAARTNRYVRAASARKLTVTALPLSARDNRILAQRLAYALRHPVTPDAVLIDIKAAELLLQRVAPGEGITEAEDTDT